ELSRDIALGERSEPLNVFGHSQFLSAPPNKLFILGAGKAAARLADNTQADIRPELLARQRQGLDKILQSFQRINRADKQQRKAAFRSWLRSYVEEAG